MDALTGVGSNRPNQPLVRLHKSDRSCRNHRQPNAVEKKGKPILTGCLGDRIIKSETEIS